MKCLVEEYLYVTYHIPNKTFIRVYYDSGEGDVRSQQDCGEFVDGFDCLGVDYGKVLVVVLVMRSLWVIYSFLRVCVLFLQAVCGDLGSGTPFVVDYSCQFWVVIVLVCCLILVDRFWVVVELAICVLPFHLLTILEVCHLDSDGPITFASRSKVSVQFQVFRLVKVFPGVVQELRGVLVICFRSLVDRSLLIKDWGSDCSSANRGLIRYGIWMSGRISHLQVIIWAQLWWWEGDLFLLRVLAGVMVVL